MYHKPSISPTQAIFCLPRVLSLDLRWTPGPSSARDSLGFGNPADLEVNLQWHSLCNVLKSCREEARCVLQRICSPGTRTRLSRATAAEQSAEHAHTFFTQTAAQRRLQTVSGGLGRTRVGRLLAACTWWWLWAGLSRVTRAS